jgi:hypothetical protein
MNRTSHVRLAAFGLLALVAGSAAPARADFNVAQGWDLFATDAGSTSFPGLGNLMGVPLGTFDFGNEFGRGLGVQNTGTADSIVQRLQAAQVAGAGQSATINVQIVALQLETTAPVNFNGNGLDNYFVTLQSIHGGPASTGTDTITFDSSGLGGTYSSSLTIIFDIRKGSLNGPIVDSESTTLTTDSTPWGNLPPTGAITIENVNRVLSGVSGDPTQDFFLNGSEGAVPEPSSLALFGLGAAATLGLSRHRSRRVLAHV